LKKKIVLLTDNHKKSFFKTSKNPSVVVKIHLNGNHRVEVQKSGDFHKSKYIRPLGAIPCSNKYLENSKLIHYQKIWIEEIDHPASTLKHIKSRVVDDMAGLAAIEMGDMREIEEQFTFPSEKIFFVRQDNKLLAYSAADTYNFLGASKVLYLSGTVIHPVLKGKGLSVYLHYLHLKRFLSRDLLRRPVYFAARTRLPRMYGAAARHLTIYPRPGIKPPADILAMGKRLANHLAENKQYDVERMVMREAFPPRIDAWETIRYHNEQINDYVKERINLATGDAFILIGKASYPQLLAYRTWQAWKNRQIKINAASKN
jgi:hypothetical protein